MNDAEGLHKSRAGFFKLGRTGDSLSRGRGVNQGSGERGSAAGLQVQVRAGLPGCHRCGRSARGRLRTRHVHSTAGRLEATAAGGAVVHTRCGDSSSRRPGASVQVRAGRPGATAAEGW